MNIEEFEQLQLENQRLRKDNDLLRPLVAEQSVVIEQLRSEVAELKVRLGLDSSNSSLPPSRDNTDRRARRAEQKAKRRAQVKAGGRKPGKQPGSPGSTLCRRPPTHTVVHRPAVCRDCGAGLDCRPVVAKATRQVLEIAQPRLEVTDHVAQSRRCSCGPRVKATAAYLLARQHLPLERTAEAMQVLFAAPMGEGSLAGVLPRAGQRLESFMQQVSKLLGDCPVTHADETSVRVGTALRWVHTVSAPGLTYLAAHARRGIEAIVDIGILDHYCGTIVHDGWSSYDRPELSQATHAQCGAHLVRHLDGFAEHPCQAGWAASMKQVLLDAQTAAEQSQAAGLGAVAQSTALSIKQRYREALTQAFDSLPAGPPPRRKHTGGWDGTQRQAWNLANRMGRHQDQVLRLLEDTRVPFTNNEAERSLRMAKLHDKISGCFRSTEHAEAFLTVRSYLQTGAKHGQNALDLLTRLWTPAGPWLPSVAIPDG